MLNLINMSEKVMRRIAWTTQTARIVQQQSKQYKHNKSKKV